VCVCVLVCVCVYTKVCVCLCVCVYARTLARRSAMLTPSALLRPRGCAVE
jgi:hypothetical protein